MNFDWIVAYCLVIFFLEHVFLLEKKSIESMKKNKHEVTSEGNKKYLCDKSPCAETDKKMLRLMFPSDTKRNLLAKKFWLQLKATPK